MLQPREIDNEKWVAIYTTYDWFCFVLPTPFVFIRFFVQFYILRKRALKVYVRESLVFFSWLCFFAYVTLYNILARPYIVEGKSEHGEQVATYVKLQYSAFLLFMTSIFGCKVFLLWWYFDLIPKSSLPKLWWFNMAALGLNISGWLAECLYQFLWCMPMKADWLRYADPSWKKYCTNPGVFNVIAWSLHLTTDMVVYIIPLLVIDKLDALTVKKRIEAGVVFALGFISVGCAGAIVVLNARRDFYGVESFGLETAYAMLMLPQMSTALVVVCVVQVRVFFRWVAGRNGLGTDVNGGSVREIGDGIEEMGKNPLYVPDDLTKSTALSNILSRTESSTSIPR